MAQGLNSGLEMDIGPIFCIWKRHYVVHSRS